MDTNNVKKRIAHDIIETKTKKFSPENKPAFLAIGSWQVWIGWGLTPKIERTKDAINDADIVEDFDYDPDGQRLFGFRNDGEGIAALNALHCMLTIDYFVLDGKNDYVQGNIDALDKWIPETENKAELPEGRIIGEILEKFAQGLEAFREQKKDHPYGTSPQPE